MGLSPEQIGSIADRGLAIKRLMGTEAGRLFSQKFETGKEARIAEDVDLRRDIFGRQVSASEERNELAAARDKVDSEYKAALVAGATRTAADAKFRRDTIDALIAGGGPVAQRTKEAVADVPAAPRPLSPIPGERLEFAKEKRLSDVEAALGEEGEGSSRAAEWNRLTEESAMYVWHDPWGPTKGWTKVQLPKGLNYRQVEVSAKAEGMTPYKWLKEAGIAE
ncbi:hypothetical protein LCGC14_1787810 [marine sediment metagenome]|uniref:Uncharacterized protein n=1 Tax=marine sediment metagenome TaxID=412755 RepID=A0A0F9J8C2_9ZZZZ